MSAMRLTGLLLAGLLLSGVRANAQQTSTGGNDRGNSATNGHELVTAEADAAIEQGLQYMAARQREDGSFGSGRYRGNVAVTSLCGMAFLAAGHTPGRGEYGDTVSRAVDYILSRCHESGFINDEDSQSHGPMYGHGFATLFLAEVYGMSPRSEVHDKLDKAVKLILDTQNDEGGWRYAPQPSDADISVTVCEIMALRAARNCGIYVPKSTVDRTVEYIRACQNTDGGFRYRLNRRSESLFARSAAGVMGLYSAGIYEGEEIRKGLGYLMQFLPQGDVFRYERHYYYGHYYAVQVMWQAGGRHWRDWYPAIRDELLRRQLSNGSWPDRSNHSTEYSTGMACLVLQMPNNYLPIFQR